MTEAVKLYFESKYLQIRYTVQTNCCEHMVFGRTTTAHILHNYKIVREY